MTIETTFTVGDRVIDAVTQRIYGTSTTGTVVAVDDREFIPRTSHVNACRGLCEVVWDNDPTRTPEDVWSEELLPAPVEADDQVCRVDAVTLPRNYRAEVTVTDNGAAAALQIVDLDTDRIVYEANDLDGVAEALAVLSRVMSR